MLFGTLGASLLGNMLAVKGIDTAGCGSQDLQSRRRKGITRAGHGSKVSLMKDL